MLPMHFQAQGQGCFGTTFVQLLNDAEGRDLRPTCILPYPGESGDQLLGGTVGGDLFLSRISKEGKPRWRRVILTSSESTELSTLNELIIDRAGMIAGVGATFNDNLQKAYCFRYDPNRDRLLYFQQPDYPSDATGISEITDGEYLITGSKQGELSPVFISAMMHRLDALTGRPVVSALRFDYFGDEAFLDATVGEDGNIYVVGNVSSSGAAGDIRSAVSKFSPDGTPLWTKVGPAPIAANARLYPFDLEIVGDKIYVLHWGSIGVITGGLNTAMMMSRFNVTDGSVDWTRKYEINEYNGESPIELVVRNDTLYTYGYSLIGKREPWLMLLDTEGTVLQTRGYPQAGSANVYLRGNQQLSVDESGIQLLASLANPGEQPRSGMFLSLDNTGQSDNACLTIRNLTVAVSGIANGWTSIDLARNNLATTWAPVATDRQSSTLLITDDCNVSCERCETTGFVRSAVCRGDSLLLNNRFVSIPGVYADTFPGVQAGCDSILFTELVASDGPQVTYEVINQCGLSTAAVRLSVAGGEFPYSYSWSEPGAAGAGPYLSSGTYRVTVNDALDCHPAIIDITVDLANRQILSFETEAPVCAGDSTGSIRLVPAGGGSLRIIPDGPYQRDGIDGLGAGSYGVILRDSTGCEAYRQVAIPEPLPVAVSISAPEFLRLGELLDLTAISPTGTDFSTYRWSAPDTISCAVCPVARFQPVVDGMVNLRVTTDQNCLATDSLFIRVLTGVPRLYLPSAFSPNEDGINDRWTPGLGPEITVVSSCRIFNRWGGLVWEYFPGDEWWGGEGQSTGIFTYSLTARMINGESIARAGTIVLTR